MGQALPVGAGGWGSRGVGMGKGALRCLLLLSHPPLLWAPCWLLSKGGLWEGRCYGYVLGEYLSYGYSKPSGEGLSLELEVGAWPNYVTMGQSCPFWASVSPLLNCVFEVWVCICIGVDQ